MGTPTIMGSITWSSKNHWNRVCGMARRGQEASCTQWARTWRLWADRSRTVSLNLELTYVDIHFILIFYPYKYRCISSLFISIPARTKTNQPGPLPHRATDTASMLRCRWRRSTLSWWGNCWRIKSNRRKSNTFSPGLRITLSITIFIRGIRIIGSFFNGCKSIISIDSSCNRNRRVLLAKINRRNKFYANIKVWRWWKRKPGYSRSMPLKKWINKRRSSKGSSNWPEN